MISANVIPPVTVIDLVEGPIDPATKRGRSGVENASAVSRAKRPASELISATRSCNPYSASTMSVAPKVLVSIMSAPAR